MAGTGQRSLLTVSANIPGTQKAPHGVEALLAHGRAGLVQRLGKLGVLHHDTDDLGPITLLCCEHSAEHVKRAAIDVEAHAPWARLLDVDVYDVATSSPVGRGELGLSPRRCLLCPAPAHACGRSQGHDAAALWRRVSALLAEVSGDQSRGQVLAASLVEGAERELGLTPKPGLVDREGSGSHTDLDLEKMQRSIMLFPRYFDALLAARTQDASLLRLVGIGRDAETRMWREMGSNAHAGYIFLAGLLLTALPDPEAAANSAPIPVAVWRARIADLAAGHFAGAPRETKGERVRMLHQVAGIEGEARAGLPVIFEEALPIVQAAYERGEDPRRAAFRAMALLMQKLEDTTTLRRAGPAGLARLRKDGAELALLLDDESAWPGAVEQHLRRLDAEYRDLHLTMGGVADCLALCFALSSLELFSA